MLVVFFIISVFNLFVFVFAVDTVVFNNKWLFVFDFKCYWVKEYKDKEVYNQWCDIRPNVYMMWKEKLSFWSIMREDEVWKYLLYLREIFVWEKDLDHKPINR